MLRKIDRIIVRGFNFVWRVFFSLSSGIQQLAGTQLKHLVISFTSSLSGRYPGVRGGGIGRFPPSRWLKIHIFAGNCNLFPKSSDLECRKVLFETDNYKLSQGSMPPVPLLWRPSTGARITMSENVHSLTLRPRQPIQKSGYGPVHHDHKRTLCSINRPTVGLYHVLHL